MTNDTIQELARGQEERFSDTKTVKGTRDYHSFHVVSRSEFEARHYTLQEHGTVLGFEKYARKINPNLNDFVAVKFGTEFNVGLVTSVTDNEIIGQFYKKSKTGTKYVFSWPTHSVEHAFLPSDIICIIQEPVPTTRTQRAFKLSDKDLDLILAGLSDT